MRLPRTVALTAAAAFATTALLTAGCAPTGKAGTAADSPATATSEGQFEPGLEDLPDAAPEPAETAESTIPMDGKTSFLYEDLVAVTVGAPKRYKPTAWAGGHIAGNTAIKLKVTFTNGSALPLDLTLASVDVALGVEGTAAETVSDDNVTGWITGTVAPGRKRSFTLAFSAPTKDLSVVDVAVTPTWEHQTALFTGSIR